MKSLVILSALSLALVACSSNNNSSKKNELCDSKWAPQDLNNTAAQEKVDSSESTKSIKMNQGEYKTPSLRIFVYDKSADIRLDLNVSPGGVNSKSGSLNYTINCIGGKGLRSNMDTLSVKIPYIAKMVVDADGKSVLTKNELTLEVANKANKGFIHFADASLGKDKSESIKDAYPKDTDIKHIIYKLSETSYESRVQFKGQGRKDTKGDERSLDLRAFVSYQKLEPTPPEKETEPIVLE